MIRILLTLLLFFTLVYQVKAAPLPPGEDEPSDCCGGPLRGDAYCAANYPGTQCTPPGGTGWSCASVNPNYCKTPSAADPKFKLPSYDDLDAALGLFNFWRSSPSVIGEIISELLPYIYVVAGLLLFVYLIYGGFQLLTSFGSPKAILEAWLIVFRALVGFIMVFVSFWLIRLVEIIFNMEII